jgi:hypothetical protein
MKKHKKVIQKTIAWFFLIGGLAGFMLSLFDVIAKDEPLFVLLLSWTALIYEGFNSVLITSED